MKRILSLLMAVTMILSVFSFQVVSAQEHSDENYSRTVTIEDGSEVYEEIFGTSVPEGEYPFIIVETINFNTPLNCQVSGSLTKKWAGHMLITYDSMYENFEGAKIVQKDVDGELGYIVLEFDEENEFKFDGKDITEDHFNRQFTQAAATAAFPGCKLKAKGEIADIDSMTNMTFILLDSNTFSFTAKNTFRTADFANSVADNNTYQDYNHTFTVYVKDGEEVSQEDYEGGGEPATHAFKVYGYNNEVLVDTTIAEDEAIVMPEASEVEGYEFKGWATEPNGAIVTPATHMGAEDLVYYAVYEEIVIPDAVTMDTPVYVTTNVLPGGAESVQIESFTVLASEILRVDTEFTYDSKLGTLEEMGMLFVPARIAGSATEADITSGNVDFIVKDACCTDIDYLTAGGNVTFRAGLIGIPAEEKGNDIYAIPYYKLSGSDRVYQAMQTVSF